MFRHLAKQIPYLDQLHPAQLLFLLETIWNNRVNRQETDTGCTEHRSDVQGLNIAIAAATFAMKQGNWMSFVQQEESGEFLWDHLIYAYMIENTRVYEIFRRVLHEYLHGERLGVPSSPAAQIWLRSTEELFYRDPFPFAINDIASHIRPDLRASRRNAYQRMFGMDLNHGTEDGKPYPYQRAEAANTEFVSIFEEFLREVWVAISNVNNTSGANPKDDSKIANLAKKLHDMLISRRMYGNLSREEFASVATMSWLHLALESNDTPIVKSLQVDAASPEQRLFKIAQRVGLPAHGLSGSYFDIADRISQILIFIEQIQDGDYDPTVIALYHNVELQSAMKTIITHWSIITGRDVKSRKVATT